MAQRLAKPKATPAPDPDHPPPQRGQPPEGHDGTAGQGPRDDAKRGTDFLCSKDDVEELYQAMCKDGTATELSREYLAEMVNNIKNTKHRKLDGGDAAKTGGASES